MPPRAGVWNGGRRPLPAYALSEEAFWLLISPEPNTGCWIWDGPSGSKGGYGTVYIGGRRWPAHHYVIKLTTGRTPPRSRFWCVMHSCDNKWCVNPDHLSVGLQSTNARDCWTRIRHPARLSRRKRGGR